MARIRSIHPGLFTDESYMGASIYARLLLPGIWCEAWDDGVIEWRPLRLKARIFPVDAIDVEKLLLELEKLDLLKPFEVDGRKYAAIRNFRKWQNPKSPNSSNVLPSCLRSYVGMPDDEAPLPEPIPSEPTQIPNNSGIDSAPMVNDFRNTSEKSQQKGGREEGRKGEGKEKKGERARGADAPPAAPAQRGSRIPDDWEPNDADAAFARGLGLNVARVAALFRDYWRGRAGADAVSPDWSAKWRTWCQREDGAKLDGARDAEPKHKSIALENGLSGMDSFHFSRWEKAKSAGFPPGCLWPGDDQYDPDERRERLLSSLESQAPGAHKLALRLERGEGAAA